MQAQTQLRKEAPKNDQVVKTSADFNKKANAAHRPESQKGGQRQATDELVEGKSCAKAFFDCKCPVCKAQVKNGDKFVTRKIRKLQYFTQSEKEPLYSFHQFVKDLIPDPNNPKERLIKGCEIFMPDTVFFKDGKIDFLAQNDRESCLSFDTKTKLTLFEVRKSLIKVSKDRKTDNVKYSIYKQAAERKQKAIEESLKKDLTVTDNQQKKQGKCIGL